MSLIPSWQTAAITLVLGMALGGYADHTIMAGRINKTNAAAAAQEQQRAVQRAIDEKSARAKEQSWAEISAFNEQEKQNEIAKIRASAAADVASVRNRKDRESTGASGVRETSVACQGSTGAELSRSDAEFLIREASRADEQRAALSVCYKNYDEVSGNFDKLGLKK